MAPPVVTSQTTTEGIATMTLGMRVHRLFRGVYKIVSSTFGLVIALMIYSFVGAAIFQYLEGGHEQEEKRGILELREEVIGSAWNLSRTLYETEDDFREQIEMELVRYENKLHDAFTHGVNTNSTMFIWDFWGSFLFCCTVYTTIGYGHLAPATEAGRIVTMIYALIGIPLCLIVMADLGKKLTHALKFIWAFIRRFYYTGNCRKVRQTVAIKAIKEGLEKLDPTKRRDSKADDLDEAGKTDDSSAADADKPEVVEVFEIDDEFNLPPIVAIMITVVYIFTGAAMYKSWETDWDYLEAFYFIFISISTIGFGDILPQHPRYFLASSIYILLGLSLVAMVITVCMELVNSTIDKAKTKVTEVGQIMGINLSQGDSDEETDDTDKESDKKKLSSDAELDSICIPDNP